VCVCVRERERERERKRWLRRALSAVAFSPRRCSPPSRPLPAPFSRRPFASTSRRLARASVERRCGGWWPPEHDRLRTGMKVCSAAQTAVPPADANACHSLRLLSTTSGTPWHPVARAFQPCVLGFSSWRSSVGSVRVGLCVLDCERMRCTTLGHQKSHSRDPSGRTSPHRRLLRVSGSRHGASGMVTRAMLPRRLPHRPAHLLSHLV
jgi:hypothetical protein